MALQEALFRWEVDAVRASEKLLAHLWWKFPNWKSLPEFASAIPKMRIELKRTPCSYLAILEESQTIWEVLAESPETVFIPVGILADDSLVGIDTESKMPLEVGRFWFEECSHLEWANLGREHFHPFSCSYDEYLLRLRDWPLDDLLKQCLI